MIPVSITVVADATGTGDDNRTVEATVADSVPVAELIPHLVDAEPGQLWRLSGPLGVLQPDASLSDSGVRPGERLTLARSGLPAPPVDDVGRLSTPVAPSPAVWVAALVAAASCVLVWAPPGAPGWHPLDLSDPARALFDGGGGADVSRAVLTGAVLLAAAVAAAAASLSRPGFVPVAAVLGVGAGLQVSVLAACVIAALVTWRPGPTRIVAVGLAAAAAVNVAPGLTTLLAVTALTFSGQLAVGLAGIRLPRIPATGLFAAAEESGRSGEAAGSTAGSATQNPAKALVYHPAIVVACCVVILAGAVQLMPVGEQAGPGWTTAALLAVAVTGLSARATRPVHAVAVTLTATLVALWVAHHLAMPWALLALAPVALPAVRVQSPMAGRMLDILETVAFTVSVPLLLATTGIFDVVRGAGVGL